MSLPSSAVAALDRFRLLHTCRSARAAVACLLLTGLLATLGGCALFGVAARALPAPTVPAKYAGLKGERVAVLVWAERGLRTDWPGMQLDIAHGIENKLRKAQKEDKPKELQGTTFPIGADTVFHAQEDHPEWAADTIEEIAPRIGASRVIYIEISNFQTRSDTAVELFRGSLTASVKVLEVNNGKSRIVFSRDNLHTLFPPRGPEEGTTHFGDYEIYSRTLDAFTTDVSQLFYPHQEEEPTLEESAGEKQG